MEIKKTYLCPPATKRPPTTGHTLQKQVIYKTRGQRADIGPIKIYRLLSNDYAQQVEHFVFLDYIPPFVLPARQLNPNAAHPHCGIATITYSLSGAFAHFDSRGHGVASLRAACSG